MISFTLFLIGTFPIDSNHSSAQRVRLRETTEDEEYIGLHTDAHTYAHTQKFTLKHPGEHTLNAYKASGIHSQRCSEVHRNKPTFTHLDLCSLRHMDVQIQTQAHSHAQSRISTSHSGALRGEKQRLSENKRESVQAGIASSTPNRYRDS